MRAAACAGLQGEQRMRPPANSTQQSRLSAYSLPARSLVTCGTVWCSSKHRHGTGMAQAWHRHGTACCRCSRLHAARTTALGMMECSSHSFCWMFTSTTKTSADTARHTRQHASTTCTAEARGVWLGCLLLLSAAQVHQVSVLGFQKANKHPNKTCPGAPGSSTAHASLRPWPMPARTAGGVTSRPAWGTACLHGVLAASPM